MTLRRTPLHSRHVDLEARLADFGGWEMPIEYSGTVAEHQSVRSDCGIFDVSHMGTVVISGPGAARWLNGILTNDLDRIEAGQAQYSMLCADDGGVVDDLIAYRVGDDEVLIVPNAANTPAVVAALEAAAADSPIEVDDRSDAYGILAVQGPRSARALEALGLPTGHAYMSWTRAHPQGPDGEAIDVIVCRTGYTGEHGYELILPASALGWAWDALVAAGASPAGLGARDTLRTEMGYALHGHELGADITPVQARLGWAVGWDKPAFGGRDALAAERAAGPHRVLRGILAEDRAIPRAGMPVSSGGAPTGTVTSGTFSPTLRRGIGLALLDPGIKEDDIVEVDVRGKPAAFRVVRPPFVPSHVADPPST